MEIPVLKPYTINPIDVEEEGNLYVLRTASGTFLKITEGVHLLMQEIDGKKDYEAISRSIYEKYGHLMPAGEVEKVVVNVLGANGLLENVEGEAKTIRGRLWLHFGLIDGSVFEKFCNRLNFLFNKRVMYFISITAAILMFLSIKDFQFIVTRNVYSIHSAKGSSILVVILAISGMLIHEIGHIAAAFHCGIKPRKIGVGLYLFIPVIYTDLTEAWTLTRKQRMITDFGGIFFELSFLFLLSPMIFINYGWFNIQTFAIMAQITILTILTNLNPLLKMDGYWIIADYTGTINIHERTRENFKNFFRRIFRSKKYTETPAYKLTPATKKFFKIWSLGYTVVTLWVIYIGIKKIPALLHSDIMKSKVTLVIVVLALFLQFMVPNLKGRIKFKSKEE